MKKKRMYSTKPRSRKEEKPFPQPLSELIDIESGLDEATEAIINEQPQLMTVDEAIDWFKKDPHEEQFFSARKGFALAYGNHYIKFENGFFTTSNPEVVAILLKSNDPGAIYNVHFSSINPLLRNFRE